MCSSHACAFCYYKLLVMLKTYTAGLSASCVWGQVWLWLVAQHVITSKPQHTLLSPLNPVNTHFNEPAAGVCGVTAFG